jgi:hypothetical protein
VTLRAELDEISARTEASVDTLFTRRRAGQLDEERFTKAAAAAVDKNNAQAVANTNREVAARKAIAEKKAAVRTAGARPFSDRPRLEGAVKQTATKKDGTPEDPETRRERLKRLGRSEPYSSAQDAMPKAMEAQGARGWVRVPNAKACKLCRHWADGKIRPASMTMLRHPGCTCLQRPVFRGKVSKKKKGGGGSFFGLTPGKVGLTLLATPGDELLVAAVIGRQGTQGRTTFLAGGRAAYRRLEYFERILSTSTPDEIAKLKAKRLALLEAGRHVERHAREIAILDGLFINHHDIYAFVDDLNVVKYTAEERRALWDYAGLHKTEEGWVAKGPVTRYNEKLRKELAFTEGELNTIELVDQAIFKNVTPRDVRVYRGARLDQEAAEALRNLEPGDVVRDKSYLFTGLTEARAMPHAFPTRPGHALHETVKSVLFEIDVPKGTPAMASPYGEALAGGAKSMITIGQIPGLRQVATLFPEGVRKQTLGMRVPFLRYFNKEELVFPRNTPMRFVSSEVRSDGVLVVRVRMAETALPRAPLPGLRIESSIIPPGFPAAATPPPSLAYIVLSDLYERGHTFGEVSRRFLDGEMGDNWLAWRNLAEEGITPSFRLRDTTSGEEFLIKGGATGAEAAVTEAISYRILAKAGWNVPEARVLYNAPPGTPGRRTMAGIQRIAETQYGPDWEQIPRGVIQQSLGRMMGGGTDNGRDVLDWIRTSGDPDAPMRTTIFDYLTGHEDRHFGNVIVIKHPDPRLPDGFDYRLLPIDNAWLGETIDHDVPFEAWVRSATRNTKWIDASRQTLDLGVTNRPFGGASEALLRIIDSFKAVDVDAILEEMLREGGYTADTFYRGERLKETIATRLANLERDFDVVAERFYRGRP